MWHSKTTEVQVYRRKRSDWKIKTTAKIFNKFSRESPYISNMFSQVSPNLNFHATSKNPVYPAHWQLEFSVLSKYSEIVLFLTATSAKQPNNTISCRIRLSLGSTRKKSGSSRKNERTKRCNLDGTQLMQVARSCFGAKAPALAARLGYATRWRAYPVLCAWRRPGMHHYKI